METSELRRGNYVSVRTSNVFMIDVIGKSHVQGITIESEFKDQMLQYQMPHKYRSSEHDYHTEPIPLTESWLVNKFGAIEHAGTPFWDIVMPRNIGYISINPNNKIIWLKHHNTDSSLNPGTIEFVHQLQNLYFCLTGEELIYKI